MKTNYSEIYVHIPFCVKKCDYCDFVSFACKEDVQKAYYYALKNQIDIKAESTGKIPVDSVFFGGGTPSLVKAEYIVGILDKLRERFSFAKDTEITIEMNPNSASFEKIREYKEAGINRVSIGLQSANDEELKTLSRVHDYKSFLRTFDNVRKAGFENVNVDIMSALPGQSLLSYMDTLKKVITLKPEHISAYSLIIEENTPFYERYSDGRGLPDEDTEREMYYETKRFLKEKGYLRYEISNYAKEGYECRHNLGYWTGKDYLGFGIAAASLYNGSRYSMHSDLDAFIKGDLHEEETILSKKDRMEEFMYLGLRMMKGVSKAEFVERFGILIEEVYGEQIAMLKLKGLMKEREGRLFLTDKGVDVSNMCMAEFLL